MSESTAAEYAERAGKDFWADYRAGHVFGLQEEVEHEGDPECEDDTCDCTAPALDAYDFWAGHVYDVEYRVGSDGSYRSAQLMIAGGGPNVYIDTGSHNLEVYWSGHASWSLPSQLIDELDELAAEMWESLH